MIHPFKNKSLSVGADSMGNQQAISARLYIVGERMRTPATRSANQPAMGFLAKSNPAAQDVPLGSLMLKCTYDITKLQGQQAGCRQQDRTAAKNAAHTQSRHGPLRQRRSYCPNGPRPTKHQR